MRTFYSADYAEATERFRTAAARAGGRLDRLEIDAKGPNGEALAIQAAYFGNTAARRVFVHSSGLHGVEGFAGSAIQLQMLASLPDVPADTALLVVHCLNPFGMAWLRRTNENNVDLNRNFLEDENYSGVDPGYVRLETFLNPRTPPGRDFFLLKAAFLVARYGMPSLRQAVAGGQYEYPNGLFFGGKQLEQGPRLYRHYLAEHFNSAEWVFAIDVHTGLGPYAQDTLLVDPAKLDNLRKHYGGRVAPIDPQGGPGYRVRGGLHRLAEQIVPGAKVQFIGQEFGTYSAVKVLHALREENRWHHYGGGGLDHAVKRTLRDAFYPQDSRWQKAVLERGTALFEQAWRQLVTS